ncbi:MAG TPA: DUF4912 domain-containing protein [Polyangium sp.]|nr:DUF4912 domain-containing protein [Polyangium sp.]
MDRHKLEGLTREELVALAGELGIVRPRSLTVPELIDDIVSRTATNERDKARSRGWLGRARTLLASVIERGLHLPDVAKALRNAPSTRPWPVAPPPLATMTLAEIYAAQGHLDKALHVLDEIIAREPEHADARSLRQRFLAQKTGHKKAETAPQREDVSVSNDLPVTADVSPAAPVVETAAPVADATPVTVETNTDVIAIPTFAEPSEVAAEPAQEAASAEVVNVVNEEAPASAAVAAVETTAIEAEEAPSSVKEPDHADSFEDEPSAQFDTDSDDHLSIEELPLPERYNVDEVVGIAVDPTTVYVYWEVRPVVLARAHARLSGGTMVVRLVCVTPTWDGPLVEQRDVPIDALFGDAYVRGLRPGSNVRIGVGWLAHGEFAPFAIGDPVSTPRKEPAFGAASKMARWTPEGASAPVESGQMSVALLASALDRAADPRDSALVRPAPTVEQALFGSRWPVFELGARASAPEQPRKATRLPLGGSSEYRPGGSSDLVRPAEQIAR